MAAVVMVVFLTIGIESRLLRLSVLFLAAGAVAGVAIRLPASLRTRLGLLSASFLAAISILPILAESPEPQPASEVSVKRVNADYLAELIRKGPFTEQLAGGLQAKGFKDVRISDAAPRVDAVALVLDWPPENDPFEGFDGPSAHFETYKSAADAARQADQRISVLKKQYGGSTYGTRQGFFIFGNREIIAGGARGHVYVEAYSFPDSNYNISLATGTVNAMLKYAEKMEKLATEGG
ncbi:hypothetical protein JS756_35170 [Streptomyces actuosus]|uniref:DUF1499 domain-containing protein n=1 Tax=Streptomyces actuosus TaxID=1885 RepID=A0ABS2W1B7_STRAS|nr:hypothetical protein [Streptomyces actuosus]MBN0049218.1 hypothetical protein [Streptomyces actuosus]